MTLTAIAGLALALMVGLAREGPLHASQDAHRAAHGDAVATRGRGPLPGRGVRGQPVGRKHPKVVPALEDAGQPPAALLPRCSVHGMVMVVGEGPLSGVTVHLDGASGARSELTSEDGSFAFHRVRGDRAALRVDGTSLPQGLYPYPAREHGIGAGDEQRARDRWTTLALTGTPQESVVLEVVRGGQLVGSVRSADGSPRPGARVAVRGASGPDRLAVTGEDGTYRFDDLPPGPILVGARHGSGGSAVDLPLSHRATVRPGEESSAPPLTFGMGGSFVRGQLTGPTGDALAGVSLACVEQGEPGGVRQALRVRSGPDGGFCLGRLPAGSWSLKVQGGAASDGQSVVPGELQTFTLGGTPRTLDLGALMVTCAETKQGKIEVQIDRTWASAHGIERLRLDAGLIDQATGERIARLRPRFPSGRHPGKGPDGTPAGPLLVSLAYDATGSRHGLALRLEVHGAGEDGMRTVALPDPADAAPVRFP